MKSENLKKILIILSILFLPCIFYLVLLKGKNHYKKLEIYGPKEVDENGDTLYHTIPSFAFLNQQGETISDEDLSGKIFVGSFFFVKCPTICPKMNENIQGVTQKFKDDKEVRFLSFTVNPESDSVSVLAEYAASHSADAQQWWFITGNKDSIYTIAREGFLVSAAEGKTADDFFHSQDLVLVDRERRIRGFYDGLDDADLRKLGDEIQVLEYEYKETN